MQVWVEWVGNIVLPWYVFKGRVLMGCRRDGNTWRTGILAAAQKGASSDCQLDMEYIVVQPHDGLWFRNLNKTSRGKARKGECVEAEAAMPQ